MKRIRQPEALAMVQKHFHPLSFRAEMDSPCTIKAVIHNDQTGELFVVTGIPCGLSLSLSQVAGLISVIELDIAAMRPSLLPGRSTMAAQERLG